MLCGNCEFPKSSKLDYHNACLIYFVFFLLFLLFAVVPLLGLWPIKLVYLPNRISVMNFQMLANKNQLHPCRIHFICNRKQAGDLLMH